MFKAKKMFAAKKLHVEPIPAHEQDSYSQQTYNKLYSINIGDIASQRAKVEQAAAFSRGILHVKTERDFMTNRLAVTEECVLTGHRRTRYINPL